MMGPVKDIWNTRLATRLRGRPQPPYQPIHVRDYQQQQQYNNNKVVDHSPTHTPPIRTSRIDGVRVQPKLLVTSSTSRLLMGVLDYIKSNLYIRKGTFIYNKKARPNVMYVTPILYCHALRSTYSHQYYMTAIPQANNKANSDDLGRGAQ